MRKRRLPRVVTALLAWPIVVTACDEPPRREDKYEPPPMRAPTLGTFQAVCGSGKTFGASKKYEKKAGQPSPLVVFNKFVDDEKARFKLADQSAREALGVLHVSPKLSDHGEDDVQLVACVEAKKKKLANSCRFHGGKLELWDMHYKVRVLEARTGNTLLTEEFDLAANTKMCPSSKQAGNHYQGADYGPKLLALVLPLQGEGVALPKVDATVLDDVCAGIPFPQTAPYEKGASIPRGLHVAYRPTSEVPFTLNTRPTGLPERGSDKGDASKTQLVACVTGKPEKKKRECTFMGGKVLELYDGRLEVAVYESAAAKLVETKTFKATSAGCPKDHRFYGARDKLLGKAEKAAVDYLRALEGG